MLRPLAIPFGLAAGFVCASALAGAQTTKPPVRKAPKPPVAKPAPDKKPAEKKPAPADLTIVSTYTTGDKTATSTVSMKGARQRIEYGNGLVTLLQCDASRTVQVNTTTNTYLTTPFADAAASTPAPPPSGSKGGQITYTTTVTDTGEKKPMFGLPARHLLTVVTKEASANACDRKPERIETDGWYVDLPAAITCVSEPQSATRVQIDPKQPNCRDDVRFVRASDVAAGYPVAYTMTASAGGDKPAVTTLAVTSLQPGELPASQFETAPGALEVKSLVQLMADHRPGEIGVKKPGVVRVGVAPIANKSDQPFAADRLSTALSESLSESELDIVSLSGGTPAEIAADAKAKECDYVLENTVAELKKPGKGMLGKLSGASNEAISAKVDFSLTAPGQAKASFSGSARSGTSTLQNAVGAAKRVVQFVAPFIMAQYGFMNTFSAMNGGASPAALGQTSDPVLGSVFKLLDRAAGKSQESFSTEESAVAAAMEKETQAIFAEMQKRKK